METARYVTPRGISPYRSSTGFAFTSLALVHMLNRIRFPAASKAVCSLGVMDENGLHKQARFRKP
jgi:hypothetical protein